MARVIFPYEDDYLGRYSELDVEYSNTMLAERGYEDDYPELDTDSYEYYEGYGEYVWPENDCNQKLQLRQCPECINPKPVSEFGVDNHRKDGLMWRCREHQNAKDRAYYRKKSHKRKAEYREENKDKNLAYFRAYNEQNREKKNRQASDWRKANKELTTLYSQNRRARKLYLPSESYDIWEVYLRDKETCQLCHEWIDYSLSRKDKMGFSIDHIVPLSWEDSPGDVLSNVQASHLSCNLSKGNRRR